jgi:hypothetical protein
MFGKTSQLPFWQLLLFVIHFQLLKCPFQLPTKRRLKRFLYGIRYNSCNTFCTYTQKPASYSCDNMYETHCIELKKNEKRYFLNYCTYVTLIHSCSEAIYHEFTFIGGGNRSSSQILSKEAAAFSYGVNCRSVKSLCVFNVACIHWTDQAACIQSNESKLVKLLPLRNILKTILQDRL